MCFNESSLLLETFFYLFTIAMRIEKESSRRLPTLPSDGLAPNKLGKKYPYLSCIKLIGHIQNARRLSGEEVSICVQCVCFVICAVEAVLKSVEMGAQPALFKMTGV